MQIQHALKRASQIEEKLLREFLFNRHYWGMRFALAEDTRARELLKYAVSPACRYYVRNGRPVRRAISKLKQTSGR